MISFKKLAIGGLVGSCALVLAACSNNGSTSNSTPVQSSAPAASGSTQSADAVTISYTDNGFSPATANVKSGQQITFKNDSSSRISVNSDPHPTHTLYPELNLNVIETGATKSVTLTKAGTYTYHNHLDPSMRGTIIVQ